MPCRHAAGIIAIRCWKVWAKPSLGCVAMEIPPYLWMSKCSDRTVGGWNFPVETRVGGNHQIWGNGDLISQLLLGCVCFCATQLVVGRVRVLFQVIIFRNIIVICNHVNDRSHSNEPAVEGHSWLFPVFTHLLFRIHCDPQSIREKWQICIHSTWLHQGLVSQSLSRGQQTLPLTVHKSG